MHVCKKRAADVCVYERQSMPHLHSPQAWLDIDVMKAIKYLVCISILVPALPLIGPVDTAKRKCSLTAVFSLGRGYL